MMTNWINQHADLFSEVGLHFLWQGTLIAALAWFICRVFLSQARARSAVYLLAMVAMAGAVPLTWWFLQKPAFPMETTELSSTSPAVPMSLPTTAPLEPSSPLPSSSHPLSWLVVTYLIGLFLMLARILRGYLWSLKVRRSGRPVIEGTWPQALQAASIQMKARFIPAMRWSESIASPVVTGILRPTILLPVALMAGIPIAQAQAILAHEIAHLRRWDHFVVLFQRALEAVFFFHPAVWFVSRQLDHERELACDDLVVAKGSDPSDYAEALVRCSTAQNHALALSASNESKLSARVLRLLGQPDKARVQVSKGGWLSILTLVSGILLLGLSPAQSDEKPTKSEAKFPEATYIAEKIDAIKIPKIDMTDATLKETINFLNIRSKELDPEQDPGKKGVIIVVKSTPGETPANPKIDRLSGENISIREVLKMISQKTDMKYLVAIRGVILMPKDMDDGTIHTRDWTVPPNFQTFLSQQAIKGVDPQLPIMNLLENAGIVFTKNSSVGLEPNGNNQTLIVRTSPLLFGEIDSLVKKSAKEFNPTIGEKNFPTQNALREITYPLVDFSNVPLSEAIRDLEAQSRENAPDKKGIRIVLPGEDLKPEDLVTYRSENVSLDIILSAILGGVERSFSAQDGVIKVLPKSALISASLPTQAYIQKKFAPDWKSKQAIQEALMKLGVEFPEGATVKATNTQYGIYLDIKNTMKAVNQISGILTEAARKPDDAANKTTAKKLHLILPKLNISKQSLRETLTYLENESKKLDPEKTGIQFKVNPPNEEIDKRMIDILILDHVPLSVALQYICDKTNTRYKLENGAVSIIEQTK